MTERRDVTARPLTRRQRVVRATARAVLPRGATLRRRGATEDEDAVQYYTDEYSCCPPPLFIIIISAVEVGACLSVCLSVCE